jgi:2-polyprenyl-3-methyl-5-hydroxy-6-metoxy-1,4-benzoquinol methylase
MTVIKDPEGNETTALHAMVDFKDRRVLEIGCGPGRLTWRYADHAAHVMAIDPDGTDIETARANKPDRLKGRLDFLQSTLADFAGSFKGRKFDVAIFSWSL